MEKPTGKVIPVDEMDYEKSSVLVESDLPLIQYIEKEQREWVSGALGPSEDLPAPSIVVRGTRGLKWIICGEYSGAWVWHVDDETDFCKLAHAMYVYSKIRRSKFWAWWYRTVQKVDHLFAREGVTSAEWQ